MTGTSKEPNHDFIDLYLHHTGESEVPQQFHLFACLSLLAASVADRVWLVRDDGGTRIYPNLYVYLIGPSGSGKEKAITTAARFADGYPKIGLFMSTGVTKQYLIDHLCRQPCDDKPHPNILYLVTEELGMAIPSKELGKELIKFMTGHYIRSGLTSYEGTRMHGQKTIKDPSLNWLAGTTDEWLTKAVDRDAIEGGFFARVLSVRGKRSGDVRFADMVYPQDREQIRHVLQQRIEAYSTVTFQFTKSKEAAEYYKEWYESPTMRPSPNDKLMEPAFNRSDEMVHRLAMILKLSSMNESMLPGYLTSVQIEQPFFEEAVKFWDGVLQDIPHTIRQAAATKESAEVENVAEIIKRLKVLDHSTLLRRCGSRGMNADQVKVALRTLTEQLDVEAGVEQTAPGHTKRVYKWVGT